MKKISSFCLLFLIIASMLLLTACKSSEAKQVESLIDSIGVVTESSYPAIDSARSAYDALSDNDRKSVSNYKVLETAESAYDQLLADRVSALIADIGDITIDSEASIKAARSAYDALTRSQQSYVMNFDVLLKAEENFKTVLFSAAKDAIAGLASIAPDNADAISEAKQLYERLIPEQKDTLKKEMGISDIEETFTAAGIKRVEGLINRVDYVKYSKQAPTVAQLTAILTAAEAYNALGSSKYAVSNNQTLKNALKAFTEYTDNRSKTDKLYARRAYIEQCEKGASYEDLLQYPTKSKGNNVCFEVVVDAFESGLLQGEIQAHINGTDKKLILKDDRKVKEPVISLGDTLVVYGKYDGMRTVKVTEEGSGLFGTNLFAKNSDSYELPTVSFIYTDKDNLGIIKADNPNVVVEPVDMIFEELVVKLSDINSVTDFKGVKK